MKESGPNKEPADRPNGDLPQVRPPKPIVVIEWHHGRNIWAFYPDLYQQQYKGTIFIACWQPQNGFFSTFVKVKRKTAPPVPSFSYNATKKAASVRQPFRHVHYSSFISRYSVSPCFAMLGIGPTTKNPLLQYSFFALGLNPETQIKHFL